MSSMYAQVKVNAADKPLGTKCAMGKTSKVSGNSFLIEKQFGAAMARLRKMYSCTIW